MLFHIGSTNVNSTNVPLAQALHVAYTFMCMPHAFMPSAQACIHAIGTSMHSCHRHKHAFMPLAQACIHAIGTSMHSRHWHKQVPYTSQCMPHAFSHKGPQKKSGLPRPPPPPLSLPTLASQEACLSRKRWKHAWAGAARVATPSASSSHN